MLILIISYRCCLFVENRMVNRDIDSIFADLLL